MAHVADAISDRILSVLESGQVKSIAKRVVASTGDKVLPAVQDVKKNVFERSISGTARCFEFPYAVNDVVVSVKCPCPFEYKSYLIAIQAVDGEFPQLRADQDGWTPATAFSGVYRYLSNENGAQNLHMPPVSTKSPFVSLEVAVVPWKSAVRSADASAFHISVAAPLKNSNSGFQRLLAFEK